jgi:hypothetical protein
VPIYAATVRTRPAFSLVPYAWRNQQVLAKAFLYHSVWAPLSGEFPNHLICTQYWSAQSLGTAAPRATPYQAVSSWLGAVTILTTRIINIATWAVVFLPALAVA